MSDRIELPVPRRCTVDYRNDPDRAFIAFRTATKRIVYPIEFATNDRWSQEVELSNALREKLSAFLREQ